MEISSAAVAVAAAAHLNSNKENVHFLLTHTLAYRLISYGVSCSGSETATANQTKNVNSLFRFANFCILIGNRLQDGKDEEEKKRELDRNECEQRMGLLVACHVSLATIPIRHQ